MTLVLSDVQWIVFDLFVMWEASFGFRMVRMVKRCREFFFKKVIWLDYGKPWVGSCLFLCEPCLVVGQDAT